MGVFDEILHFDWKINIQILKLTCSLSAASNKMATGENKKRVPSRILKEQQMNAIKGALTTQQIHPDGVKVGRLLIQLIDLIYESSQ